MNSETQRSPVPTIRRTVKRLDSGWTVREACMLCRPLMRSPGAGIQRVSRHLVYVVLNVEVIYVRGGPVAVECPSNFHSHPSSCSVLRRSYISALYAFLPDCCSNPWLGCSIP